MTAQKWFNFIQNHLLLRFQWTEEVRYYILTFHPCSNRLGSQFYIQLIYKAALSYIQFWNLSGSLLKPIYLNFRIFFSHFHFNQFFSADVICNIFEKFKKKCPKKVENPPLKSWSEILFLHYGPELPKQSKQKNSYSKMWLIDQLYIKLGPGYLKCTLTRRP